MNRERSVTIVRSKLWLIPGLATAAVVAVLATATGASAAVSTSSGVAVHPAAQRVTAPAVVTPDGAPKGCEGGFYCSYNKAGGGNLCIATPASESTWGSCSYKVLAIFNNGAATYVRFYPLPDYVGAWYCLEHGHYLLDLTKNKFDQGVGKPDYDNPMALDIDSSRLSSIC